MASNSRRWTGKNPHRKQAGTSSGPTPLKPPSAGNTSHVVEASGTAKPGGVVSSANTSRTANGIHGLSRPTPPRPWRQNFGTSYGGYGSCMYGSYGGLGGSYGGGLYYGNRMYNSGCGPMGGYGMCMGGPYGGQDPSHPPPSPPPPDNWVSFIRALQGVVNFLGRIAILIDQNTRAFHMLMSALLQFVDRSGLLYGELARFVLRIL